MSGEWEETRARLEEQHLPDDDGLCITCGDSASWPCDIRDALQRISQQEEAARLREIDCASLEAECSELLQRVQELERQKHGTPCKCEEWIEACRKAEARVEELERLDAANVVMMQGQVEEADRLKAKLARCVELLSDFDWDETGTPTGWPIRERVDAALAAAKGK